MAVVPVPWHREGGEWRGKGREVRWQGYGRGGRFKAGQLTVDRMDATVDVGAGVMRRGRFDLPAWKKQCPSRGMSSVTTPMLRRRSCVCLMASSIDALRIARTDPAERSRWPEFCVRFTFSGHTEMVALGWWLKPLNLARS